MANSSSNLNFGFVKQYSDRGYGYVSGIFGEDCWFHVKTIPDGEIQRFLDDSTSHECQKVFFWYCAERVSGRQTSTHIWTDTGEVPKSKIEELIQRLLPNISFVGKLKIKYLDELYLCLFEQLFKDSRFSDGELEPILNTYVLLRNPDRVSHFIRPSQCVKYLSARHRADSAAEPILKQNQAVTERFMISMESAKAKEPVISIKNYDSRDYKLRYEVTCWRWYYKKSAIAWASPNGKKFVQWIYALKDDSSTAAKLFAEVLLGVYRGLPNNPDLIVPIPPSSDYLSKPDYGLAEVSRIVSNKGCGRYVHHFIRRKYSVPKSSSDKTQKDYQTQKDSMEIGANPLQDPRSILIMDDIYTTGSHMNAVYDLVTERYPGIPICLFAFSKTQKTGSTPFPDEPAFETFPEAIRGRTYL